MGIDRNKFLDKSTTTSLFEGVNKFVVIFDHTNNVTVKKNGKN